VVLGLLLGGPAHSLLLLFIASLFGVMASLPFILLGKAGRKTLIPFGPFLLGATVIIVLFGQIFFSWFDRLAG
jgi:prepilin signal peptidase PulO-like enzyme (type II secretory pathway)